MPDFFVNNRADYRQIVIQSFIYFRPNGTSDIGTTFHSSDLYDQEYSQSELDFFVGLSGTSIAGTYTLNTRRRKFTFWFKDYARSGGTLHPGSGGKRVHHGKYPGN